MREYQYITPYLIITLVLLAFNFIAVFGLHTIIDDDQTRYSTVINCNFPLMWLAKRNLLSPFLLYPFFYLMTISPALARLSILLVWMIPISLLFYYVSTKILHVNVIASITASVLPCILPGQIFLPSFINGSYMLPSLFFIIVTIIFWDRYLKIHGSAIKDLSVSIIAFLIALLSSELSIFILPPIIFLFYTKFGKNRKLITISSILISASLIKVITVILFPVSTNIVQFQDVSVIWDRVLFIILYIDPFRFKPYSTAYYLLNGIILFIIITSYIILVKQKNNRSMTNNVLIYSPKEYLFVCNFSIIWFCFAILPFVYFSKLVAPRYFFYAGFGFYLLLAVSVSTLIFNLLPKINTYGKLIVAGICLTITIFSGTQRMIIQKTYFRALNKNARFLQEQFSDRNFPLNSQIVILGKMGITTGGHYLWSCGYLQHTLKRNDLNGILPYEKNYYNPFDTIGGRNYTITMSGLSLKFPVFLFKKVGIKLKQYEYALQWENPKSKDSQWVIYKFDTVKGASTIVSRSAGWSKYTEVIDSLAQAGIPQNMIMFGGRPTKEDIIRLGLTDCK